MNSDMAGPEKDRDIAALRALAEKYIAQGSSDNDIAHMLTRRGLGNAEATDLSKAVRARLGGESTIRTFIACEMKVGSSVQTIADKLCKGGFEPAEKAHSMVQTAYASILTTAAQEEFMPSSLMPACMGALLAGVLGGIAWGLIVIATDYEIGYVALGLGALSGGTVVAFARGKKGLPLQILAALSSVLGILIGKYITFFHFLKKYIAEHSGKEAASAVKLFSADVVSAFIQNLGEILDGYGILWVVLAVATAWRIPKSLGIQVPRQDDSGVRRTRD